MGLEINYWDCKFSEYYEDWDGEEETRYYNCLHKDGCKICDLDNKWNDEKQFCELTEKH